ncbi:EamA-like transporter family protein [Roseovarius albus]|uniref:EamA-like transporter family protein n=1 Tax=Roseovarius albus TaxID=1247867 RepID=A0A1X6ZCT9_9RHOB|nr:DMT family transporter [Roseovarius albus]SLN45993.1 EamA-like transporter family protein [Roseovarius albus]
MSLTDLSNRPQNLSRGITLVIAAAFSISLQDLVIKLYSTQLTLWQIFALRGVLMLPLLYAVAWCRGVHRNVLRLALQRWVMLRSLFLASTFLAFYAALPFLNLSTVGAANYVAPIFVTLLSAYVIVEPVGPRGWFAVLIGFLGVVMLLQPGTDAFSYWAILPLIGATFYALAHITTRVKCHDVPLSAVALSLNLVMMAAGILGSLVITAFPPTDVLTQSYPYIFGKWGSLGVAEWQILFLLACLSLAIYMLLAGAYQAAPPSNVATFEYSYLIFVVIWDYLFFALLPNALSIFGMVLIVSAGLMVLRKQR